MGALGDAVVLVYCQGNQEGGGEVRKEDGHTEGKCVLQVIVAPVAGQVG